VQQRYVYDPYGNFIVLADNWAAGSDGFNWLYTFQGGRYDNYTGLYTYQRREYDPTVGRWIQQDPGGYLDGANLYKPMLDAPTEYMDPMGLQAQSGAVPPATQQTGANQYSNVPGATTQPGGGNALKNLPSEIQRIIEQMDDDHWNVRHRASDAMDEELLRNPHLRDGLEQVQKSGSLSPEAQSRLDNALDMERSISAEADPSSVQVGQGGTIHVKFTFPPGIDDSVTRDANGASENETATYIRYSAPEGNIFFPRAMQGGGMLNVPVYVSPLLDETQSSVDFRAGDKLGIWTVRISVFHEYLVKNKAVGEEPGLDENGLHQLVAYQPVVLVLSHLDK
jgi:RHS repeat-associated protein